MEDVSHPSQSDVEQPHPQVNHSRPFFYVQPPSQPYFMYQWPMDPFGQYGFPGPAFPFGRPYMPPYQFMQYPGYVVPHAPMQPNEYRRVSPLFPSVASYDLRFRQHFQQMSMHRETMSSEAQTEPGDPGNKLMKSLDDLQACEKSSAVEESNLMVSSTPAVISFTHEVEKMNCGAIELNMEPGSLCDKAKPDKACDSAVYEAELSQGQLEECLLSDVLPFDSSSIHNKSQSQDQGYKQDNSDKVYFQSERSGTGSHSAEVQDSGAHVSDCNGTFDLYEGKSSITFDKSENLPHGSVGLTEPLLQMSADCDLPYQILHLPCNATTTSLLEKDPLLYVDTASALLPARRDAFGSPYTHSYYPRMVPERQSVLSPSLDELSSRDEMFSTDIEDELTSGQIYVDGGKLAETGAVPTLSQMNPTDETSSVWAKTCACCGASLPDEDLSPAEVLDQVCDCEFEEETEAPCAGDAQKVVLRQKPAQHSLSPCANISKHKAREVLEVIETSGQDQDHCRGEYSEKPHPAAKGNKGRSKGQKSSQFRFYSEHFQREGPGDVMDQEGWASCSGKQRSRSCRPTNNLQEKGKPARRRPSCKNFAQQRPRRNEYDDHNEAEFSYCQRGRGSTKRRGTRY